MVGSIANRWFRMRVKLIKVDNIMGVFMSKFYITYARAGKLLWHMQMKPHACKKKNCAV